MKPARKHSHNRYRLKTRPLGVRDGLLPSEWLAKIETEEDLRKICKNVPTNATPDEI